ncbi:hypothetical protein NYS55_17740 [Curtobacterium flaccumfaciens pv. flaccumfaciens]|uniref:hypothetical protein n=1 Tax=Curtobacterium flaccumfaciens TaxID=2035 RepID=UPI00217E2F6E|nr:hypothetical protein [Curtobacterium flaccumfaciens]MCS6553265.1 hypothetical protein [Curtobacterium flaccumfaciens pv. flaccumfaciens]
MGTITNRAFSLDNKLRREWEDEISGRVHAFGSFGIMTAAAMLEQARRGVDEDRDELLHELLCLAHHGDQTAERVLLQLLIPAARNMAHRVHALDELSRNDRVDIAIGAAWESIRRYKLHLRARVMANLTMGTLSVIAPKPSANDRLVAGVTTCVTDEVLEHVAGAWTKPEPSPESELANLLTWAVDTHVVTTDEVALLDRAYLGEESHTAIATDLGITSEGVRKRLARVRNRIGVAARTAYAA